MADGAPLVGWGKTFLRVGQFFFVFYKNDRNEKSIRSLEMDRLSEGYKRAIDKIWGPTAKNRFSALKKDSLLNGHHVLATTGQSYANEIVPFSQINISRLADFGCFF